MNAMNCLINCLMNHPMADEGEDPKPRPSESLHFHHQGQPSSSIYLMHSFRYNRNFSHLNLHAPITWMLYFVFKGTDLIVKVQYSTFQQVWLYTSTKRKWNESNNPKDYAIIKMRKLEDLEMTEGYLHVEEIHVTLTCDICSLQFY